MITGDTVDKLRCDICRVVFVKSQAELKEPSTNLKISRFSVVN